MDTDSLAVSLARKLSKIVDYVAIINIVHEAHKRVREIMRDRFKNTVLHKRKRYNAPLHLPPASSIQPDL